MSSHNLSWYLELLKDAIFAIKPQIYAYILKKPSADESKIDLLEDFC